MADDLDGPRWPLYKQEVESVPLGRWRSALEDRALCGKQVTATLVQWAAHHELNGLLQEELKDYKAPPWSCSSRFGVWTRYLPCDLVGPCVTEVRVNLEE